MSLESSSEGIVLATHMQVRPGKWTGCRFGQFRNTCYTEIFTTLRERDIVYQVLRRYQVQGTLVYVGWIICPFGLVVKSVRR